MKKILLSIGIVASLFASDKLLTKKELNEVLKSSFIYPKLKKDIKKAKELLENCLPISSIEAKSIGLVDKILKNGKSVIFTSGHIGNWEMLVVGVASQIVPGVGVAEKLKNPYLNKILFESRERFRIGVIPMKGALRKLVYSIRKGVPVFIIMDQAVNPGRGTEKDFFGFPAIHTETPQYLSKKYDLFIVPTFIKQQDNGKYLIEFEKPFKADEVQDCLHYEIDILEKRIIENTEQWLWCHKRWKNHKDFYK